MCVEEVKYISADHATYVLHSGCDMLAITGLLSTYVTNTIIILNISNCTVTSS